MKENFDKIMEEIFRQEGGYVDHPSDPGGATNMGITHRTLASWRKIVPYTSLPKSEVKSLKKAEALSIYKANYWNKVKGDQLPSGVDCFTMDYGVNSGPDRSIKTLQRALGVTQDGVIGPNTLEALRKTNPVKVIEQMYEYRMAFLRGLKTWGSFGRGWTKRCDSVKALSLRLAGQPTKTKTSKPEVEETNLLGLIIKIILKLLGRANV